MSNLIVPDVAKIEMAKVTAGIRTISKIDLFQNNYSIVHGTTIANLTVAAFGGYAQGTMAGATVAGALDSSSRAVTTWNPVTFTCSGAPLTESIYGYYVTSDTGTLLWAETFDNPVVVNLAGIFIQLTPQLTDMSQFLNT